MQGGRFPPGRQTLAATAAFNFRWVESCSYYDVYVCGADFFMRSLSLSRSTPPDCPTFIGCSLVYPGFSFDHYRGVGLGEFLGICNSALCATLSFQISAKVSYGIGNVFYQTLIHAGRPGRRRSLCTVQNIAWLLCQSCGKQSLNIIQKVVLIVR